MKKCELCDKNTVVKVAENDGLDFYSCCNEECSDYSELLIETNGGLENVHDMMDAYREIVKEITNEKDKFRRG